MRIIAVALTGWAAIVALAWKLANDRIALCGYLDNTCAAHATAARDYVLIGGLTVALIGVLATMILAAIARPRSNRTDRNSFTTSTNRAELPRLR